MLKEILNQTLPIIIQAIVAILGVIISAIGVVVIKFIVAKKKEIIDRLGKVEYEKRKSYAFDAWNFVEEHFRVSGLITVTINEKIALFEKELLNKVPGLTQNELDSLRLALAGEINKGKAAVNAPIEASQMATQPLQ